MDLGDPTRAVVPTLDGPVLVVLARAGRPLTVGEVAAQTKRGSEIGVRRVLGRLVEQGIVRAHQMGRNRVHELNREHVAADAAIRLAGLRGELWQRMREALDAWDPRPVYVSLDLRHAVTAMRRATSMSCWFIRPFQASQFRKQTGGLQPWGRLFSRELPVVPSRCRPSFRIDQPGTRNSISSTGKCSRTGNRLQVLDLSPYEWSASGGAVGNELRAEIRRDAIDLTPRRVIKVTS